MTAPKPNKPDPLNYQRQRAIVLQRADQDVVRVLQQLQRDTIAMLREVASRPKGIGRDIREAQLRLVQRNLHAALGKAWREIGDITEARRSEAAARSLQFSRDENLFRLVSAGVPDGGIIAQNIYEAEANAAASGLDRMIARQAGASYVPLKDRVYNSEVGIGSKVDRLVNSALARGLSAVEFASEVRRFINPLTPGGVSYAAKRLARTEINNAAHAMSVEAVREVPWIPYMEWRLSGSHGRPDVCDAYAKGGLDGDGKYPKHAVPAKPHPQCLCYVIPVSVDDDTFENNLLKGNYNQYLERYRNLQPGQVVKTSYSGFSPPVKPPVSKPTQTKVATPPKPKAKPPTQTKPTPPGTPTSRPPVKVDEPGVVIQFKPRVTPPAPPVNPQALRYAEEKIKANQGMATIRHTVSRNFNMSEEEAEKLIRSIADKHPNTLAGKQAAKTAPRVSSPTPRVSQPTTQSSPVIRSDAPTANQLPRPNVSKEIQDMVRQRLQISTSERGYVELQAEMEFQAAKLPGVMRKLRKVGINETDRADIAAGKNALVNGLYYRLGAPGGAVRGPEIQISRRVMRRDITHETRLEESRGTKSRCGHDHSGTQSVFAHEFGHHVDYMVRSFNSARQGEVLDTAADAMGVRPPIGSGDIAWSRWIKDNKDVITREVSTYAATNRTEFLAEVWREYSTNPNARPIVKKIGAKLEELARGGELA